jgi:hypothetical protein
MTRRKTPRRICAILLSTTAAITLATPALAACGLTAESVAKAEVVFVGLLADVSGDGNSATLQVEEIWRGSGLVVGMTVGIDTTNSLQRLELPPPGTPVSASRYVVLANTVGGQLHTGDSCEVFPFPWDDSYAALGPAAAPPPSGSPTADGGFPAPVVAVGAALLLLAVVGVVAFSRGQAKGA